MAGSRQLGPLAVRAQTRADAVNAVTCALERRSGISIAFANTHLVYQAIRDPQLARTLEGFVVLNDGVGVNVIARLCCGEGFPENLNGTDFTPLVLAQAPAGTRVYLYGARPEVNARARSQIAARYPDLVVCGARHGHDPNSDAQAIADIANAKPDLVLAALGNPLQERFIADAAGLFPQVTFIGVGALFDFVAGAAPRAPAWLRTLRLEWCFRLMREPSRLWRRYTVEILLIASALVSARMSALFAKAQ